MKKFTDYSFWPNAFKTVDIFSVYFLVTERCHFRHSFFLTVYGYFMKNICLLNVGIFLYISHRFWGIRDLILIFLPVRLTVYFKFDTPKKFLHLKFDL